MRKMGIDYGTVRIGIALSDILGILATAYENYNRVDELTDLQHIQNIAKEMNVDTIIIGLPTHLDGTLCDLSQEIKSFADKIKNLTNLPVKFQSELLSSIEAEELLKNAKYSQKERKNCIDKIAATIILQNYLDEQ